MLIRADVTSPVAESRTRSAFAYSLVLFRRPRSQSVGAHRSAIQHRLTPSRPQLIHGRAATGSAPACGGGWSGARLPRRAAGATGFMRGRPLGVIRPPNPQRVGPRPNARSTDSTNSVSRISNISGWKSSWIRCTVQPPAGPADKWSADLVRGVEFFVYFLMHIISRGVAVPHLGTEQSFVPFPESVPE